MMKLERSNRNFQDLRKDKRSGYKFFYLNLVKKSNQDVHLLNRIIFSMILILVKYLNENSVEQGQNFLGDSGNGGHFDVKGFSEISHKLTSFLDLVSRSMCIVRYGRNQSETASNFSTHLFFRHFWC